MYVCSSGQFALKRAIIDGCNLPYKVTLGLLKGWPYKKWTTYIQFTSNFHLKLCGLSRSVFTTRNRNGEEGNNCGVLLKKIAALSALTHIGRQDG